MIKVEIDEEAVAINGIRFDAPPSIQHLAKAFSAQPTRHFKVQDAFSNRPHEMWTWDQYGVSVEAVDEASVQGYNVYFQGCTKPDKPTSPFKGSCTLFGIDIAQDDAMDLLRDRMYVSDHRAIASSDGPYGAGNKEPYVGRVKLEVFAPSILFYKHDSILGFQFPPRAAQLPPGVMLNDQEKVLACLIDHPTLNFFAAVSDQRIVVAIPGRELLQWSLKDVRDFRLRPDVVSPAEVGNALKTWEYANNNWVQNFFNRTDHRPPLHVVEIETATGTTRIAVTRPYIDGDDYGQLSLLDVLADSAQSAIRRYRDTASPLAPILVCKEKSTASNFPAQSNSAFFIFSKHNLRSHAMSVKPQARL